MKVTRSPKTSSRLFRATVVALASMMPAVGFSHDEETTNSQGQMRQSSGDTNGDGVIDVSDVIYSLSFLFLGGEPPVEIVCDAPEPCENDTPEPGSEAGMGSFILDTYLFSLRDSRGARGRIPDSSRKSDGLHAVPLGAEEHSDRE